MQLRRAPGQAGAHELDAGRDEAAEVGTVRGDHVDGVTGGFLVTCQTRGVQRTAKLRRAADGEQIELPGTRSGQFRRKRPAGTLRIAAGNG